jgi:hypothetical protein
MDATSATAEQDEAAFKRRLVYVVMGLAGIGFVSTPFLPVSESTAQFVAVLLFGIMSGLWLGNLIRSV